VKRTFPRTVLALLLTQVLVAPALAAGSDPLDLQGDPMIAEAGVASSRVFVEAALGVAAQRYGLGSRTITRGVIDGRHAVKLGASMQAVVAARIDGSDPEDERIDGAVFSLREAYLGWQDEDAAYLLEFGRINLREGPGYGYNPTDFFRDNALRTVNAVNPLALRENRMGSVLLRAQHLWPGGSVSAVLAPELASERSTDSFSLDLGSTNARHRGLLSLANRLSDRLDSRLTIYKEAGSSARLGASFTALVSDAAVVHAEWSTSREPALLERALAPPSAGERRQRWAAGLTYTTATRLSVTAELQYNGFALDRDGWRALVAAGPQAPAAYFTEAVALQDNASRRALMLYAVQRDLGLKNLELTALLRHSVADRSRMLWFDLRYRMERVDLAVQLQHTDGPAGSEFGLAPIRDSVSLVWTAHF
jgi:hypothetical protein